MHFRQQPTLFERAFLLAHSHRPVQQQSFGFAHRPDGGLDRVPAQLPERGDALVAVDDQIAGAVVRGGDDDNRRLLARLSQRRQQTPLEMRLADSEMRPSLVELVKFQLHGYIGLPLCLRDKMNVRRVPAADQYVWINGPRRALRRRLPAGRPGRRRSRSQTRSNARRHWCEQNLCRGERDRRTNPW